MPKSYARYAWWIFDQPVIDHPQMPNTTTKWNEVTDINGRKRYYEKNFRSEPSKFIKPYDGTIYPTKKCHITVGTNGEYSINIINDKFWIQESKIWSFKWVT